MATTIQQNDMYVTGFQSAGRTVINVFSDNDNGGAIGEKNADTVMAIDMSGSMAGTPERIINEKLGDVVTEDNKNNMKILSFNTQCSEVSTQRLPISLRAGGGTMFGPAFVKSAEVIDRHGANGGHWLFLTDGVSSDSYDENQLNKYNYNRSYYKKALDTITPILAERGIALHIVAFTTGHNLAALQLIQKMLVGVETTYDYVSTSAELGSVFDKFLAATTAVNVNESYVILEDETRVPVTQSAPGMFFLDEDAGRPTQIVLDGREVDIDFLELPDEAQTFEAFAAYVSGTIKAVAKMTTSPNKNSEEMSVLVSDLQAVVDEEEKKLVGDGEMRKKMREVIMGMRQKMNQLHDIIFTGSLTAETNMVLHSLQNHMPPSISTRDQRKARQRAAKNLRMMALKEAKKTAAVAKIKEILAENPEPELYNQFECLYSAENAAECAAEGEMMCLPITVNRRPGTAMDPSMIGVSKVGTTVLTEGSVYELTKAVIASLGPNPPENVMEDRFGNGGIIFSDVQRVIPEFNAALPLYISPAHWSLAKCGAVERALGWAYCLNYGASTYAMRCLYYLVYLKFRQIENKTELQTRRMEDVRKTCENVMNGEDSAALVQQWSEHLTNLSMTREFCTNQLVFLARFLVAGGELTQEMVNRIVLTECWARLRDKTARPTKSAVMGYLVELLDIPVMTDEEKQPVLLDQSDAVETPGYKILVAKEFPNRRALTETVSQKLNWALEIMGGFINTIRAVSDGKLPTAIPVLMVKGILASVDMSLSEFTGAGEPDVLDSPEEWMDWLSRELWKFKHTQDCQALLSQRNAMISGNQVERWMASPNDSCGIVNELVHFCKGEGGIHSFHEILVAVRLAAPGTLVNARAKYDWLRKECPHWHPSKRSNRAFEKHF